MRTRRLQILVVLLFVALVPSWLATAASSPVPGDGPWLQYADPALAGFNAEKLEAVHRRADEIGTGALFVVRKGLVVAAWGEVDRKFKCHSVRKSLLSALYGEPVAQGQIDLDATLESLDIDDIHGLTDAEKQATVEQLIQSRSGVYHPAAKEPRSMKQSRPERGGAAPGERFWYNNWDFNMAGFVFESATGRGIFEAFREDLAVPLGMEDFQLDDTLYQYERSSSRVPAYAFRLSARDAARFGLLYLRDGSWDGKQLVPTQWIERSWEVHSDFGDGEGFGYMWWIYGPGSNPALPDLAAYVARGTGGQAIVVIPKLDLVIVHRADTDFSRGVGGGEVWELIRGIVDAIDGKARLSRKLAPVDVRRFSRQLPPLVFPETISLPGAVLDRYVGQYRVNDDMRVSIERIDDFLVGTAIGLGETDFFAVSETKFWSKAAGATVTFEVDSNGAVVRATLRYRGKEMVAVPVVETTAASTANDSPGRRPHPASCWARQYSFASAPTRESMFRTPRWLRFLQRDGLDPAGCVTAERTCHRRSGHRRDRWWCAPGNSRAFDGAPEVFPAAVPGWGMPTPSHEELQ